jgi:5S rRNA maturation endonuclease (ribonuclease M5)
MDYRQTLDDLTKLLEELNHDNQTIPIIVEGIHDKQALQSLGIKGKIIPLNKGMSIANFCDKIASENTKIILLTDWDRKGGHLLRIIYQNLEGRITINIEYRKSLAKLSLIRTIEGLPSWINTLKKKVQLEKT